MSKLDKDYHKIILSMENRITQLEKMLSDGVNHNFEKLFERMELLEDFTEVDGRWEDARNDLHNHPFDDCVVRAFVLLSTERERIRKLVTGCP